MKRLLLILSILVGFSTSVFASNMSKPVTVTNEATATALAADPTDCSAGQAPRGINASGTAQNCTVYLQSEVDGSITNEIEVVDEAFTAGNFDGGTASAVSQDDFYDYQHIGDTDDDGLINKVDTTTNGVVTTGSSNGTLGVSTNLNNGSIIFSIDGGGAQISTGLKSCTRVDTAIVLDRWTILADVSGAVKIDVWKDVYANYPPDNSDSMTNAHEPEITASGVTSEDTNISDWTTVTVAAGDVVCFNVDSATSVTKVTLIMSGEKS